MNLKTHTAYQEIQMDEHNIAHVKIIDGSGKVVREDVLVGKDAKESLEKALKFVAAAEILYKREDV